MQFVDTTPSLCFSHHFTNTEANNFILIHSAYAVCAQSGEERTAYIAGWSSRGMKKFL